VHFLEKLILVTQLDKKFATLIEPHVHKSPPLYPTTNHFNPLHPFISCPFEIHFNRLLTSNLRLGQAAGGELDLMVLTYGAHLYKASKKKKLIHCIFTLKMTTAMFAETLDNSHPRKPKLYIGFATPSYCYFMLYRKKTLCKSRTVYFSKTFHR
jgi:hypothetical protein